MLGCMVMIRGMIYTIKQAFINLWRNRGMTVASLLTVTATLLVLGVVFILIVNISNFSEYANDQFDSIQVFLEDGLTNAEMREIGEEILKIDEVANVTFESKTQALEKMKIQWKEHASVLAGLEERNPLPNTYVVNIDNLIYSDSIVRKIEKINGIEMIKYYKEVIQKIENITFVIRSIGLGIIALLLFVSTFAINNTIKLGVAAREEEISIMKYLGATHWFVRWPFLVEGTMIGLLGALLSMFLMEIGFSKLYEVLTNDYYVLIAAYIVPVKAIMRDLFEVFVPVGAGVGALGSLWGVRKYLNV